MTVYHLAALVGVLFLGTWYVLYLARKRLDLHARQLKELSTP